MLSLYHYIEVSQCHHYAIESKFITNANMQLPPKELLPKLVGESDRGCFLVAFACWAVC